jgi:hypothetical protein
VVGKQKSRQAGQAAFAGLAVMTRRVGINGMKFIMHN